MHSVTLVAHSGEDQDIFALQRRFSIGDIQLLQFGSRHSAWVFLSSLSCADSDVVFQTIFSSRGNNCVWVCCCVMGMFRRDLDLDLIFWLLVVFLLLMSISFCLLCKEVMEEQTGPLFTGIGPASHIVN